MVTIYGYTSRLTITTATATATNTSTNTVCRLLCLAGTSGDEDYDKELLRDQQRHIPNYEHTYDSLYVVVVMALLHA